MAGSNLFVYLDMIRAEMPEVDERVWEGIKRAFRNHAPGERLYVPAEKKRDHLEKIAVLGPDTGSAILSRNLGISVRRVRQLKKLLED